MYYVQNNTGQAGGIPKLDLNVEPAWALGYTGKGVTTGIMDDGIDYMHLDLEDNFVRIPQALSCSISAAFVPQTYYTFLT